MNLAFLARRYGRIGGTERDLYELTARLAAKGHEIHIYCCEARADPPTGVRVHPIPVLGFGRLAQFYSVAFRGPRRARKNGHDLLISYERAVDQDIARCGGGTHRRFLERMAENSSPLRRLAQALDPYHRLVLYTERRQFTDRGCRRVHAVSAMVKQELMDVYGVTGAGIDVVYCGVDTDVFRPDGEHRARVRSELDIAPDVPVALFLGNGFARKGLDSLLRALAEPNATATAVHGLVVGTDSHLASYEEMVRKMGIDARVAFAGQQSETCRYYAAADVFVLPSVQEAFGVVVLEAMATGLPCIVSSRAGAAEVLPESTRPFLLNDPRDAGELSSKLRRILDPSIRPRIAADCRAAAMRYSLDEHTRQSETLYRAMC